MSLEVALSYVDRGLSVIPAHGITGAHECTCGDPVCGSPGKHPRIKWGVYQNRRATSDEVAAWWTRWPAANIAIVTGAISGIIVLDIDPRHDGDVSIKPYGSPETWTCLTGGGGTHWYFTHPGKTVPNGANLLPGVDLRGDGGYVIAPPSMHLLGSYAWEVGYAPSECILAGVPPSLSPLIAGWQPGSTDAKPAVAMAELIEHWIARGIPYRERNHTMTRIAGYYLGLGMSAPDVRVALLGMASCCEQGPDIPPYTLKEVDATLASVAAREQRQRAALETAITTGGSQHSDGERHEAARALWASKGIPAIAAWEVVRDGEDISWRLELPDDEVPFKASLLNQRATREALYAHTNITLPRLKADAWDAFAAALGACAVEVVLGPRDQADQVAELIEDYFTSTRTAMVEVDPEHRIAALADGPIPVEGIPTLKLGHLRVWLQATQGERKTVHELATMLRRGKWERQSIRCGEQILRVWQYRNGHGPG